MILLSIRMNPFGCFTDTTLEFDPGMNVVLGPNEAGKSTAFNAIRSTLFSPVQFTKVQYRKEMERFTPLGGDTISGETVFLRNGERYAIRRNWGARNSCELRLPDASLVSGEKNFIERIEELLPATPGTFGSVLMTGQAGLARTIQELKGEHAETVRSLGDILRKALMETDGVSIDRLRENIERLHISYFSHWDANRRYPEKGKGIEDPWKKEIGIILKGFYEKEQIRISLEAARRYETEFDELNLRIVRLEKQIETGEKFLRENTRSFNDAAQRRMLEAEFSAIETILQNHAKVNADWPVREHKVTEAEEKLPSIDDRLTLLEKERNDAAGEQNNRQAREKYARASEKKTAYESALSELQKIRKVTRLDLEEIRKAASDVEKMKARVLAGRLHLRFFTKEGISFFFRKDLDGGIQKEIGAGHFFETDACGIAKIEHENWSIEISSGAGTIDEVMAGHAAADTRLTLLLEKHGLDNIEEAAKSNELYERQEDVLKKNLSILEAELKGKTFAELEAEIQLLGPETSMRPIEKIIEEHTVCRSGKESLRKEIESHRKVLSEYREQYGGMEKLLLNLAGIVGRKKELKDKIDSLAPLPEGFVRVEDFLSKFEDQKHALDQDVHSLRELQLQRAGLEAKAPESSVEELAQALSIAEEEFDRLQKKGESVSRIRKLTEAILAESGSEPHLFLKKDLEKYVVRMTASRYEKVEMEASGMPEGFVRGDGKKLGYALLSAGTKDILSLALRLAMANHFLKESDGFLMLDDPLVDLDPGRQLSVASVLREFAEHKQTLIFTCHPSHAELLGGKRITLAEGSTNAA